MRKLNIILSVIGVSILSTACGGGNSTGTVAPAKQGSALDSDLNKEEKSALEVELETAGIKVEKNIFPQGEVRAQPIGYGEVTGFNRQYSFNGVWVRAKNESGVKEFFLPVVSTVVGGLSANFATKYLGNLLENPERDIFYFGVETEEKNIPVSGTAVYRGNATRYDNLTAKGSNVGKSEFIVDFSQKTIKGELIMDLFRRNISLKETPFTGNKFEGVAVAGENSIFSTVEGHYEGKFYGPNAEEIAGKATFAQEKDLDTSFGAKREGNK